MTSRSRLSPPSLVVLVALAGLALPLVGAAPARAWEVEPQAPPGALVELHERFSLMAYPYPRHSAEPLGVIGFEIFGEVAALPDADDASVRPAVDGDFPADALAVYRVGVRKGLPWDVDLGVSLAKTVDGEIDLASAELSWAILDGSLVSPALGLRLTGTRTLDADHYELEQYGAELILSKGFPLITPYVGGGFVWSEGRFDRGESGPLQGTFTTDGTDTVLFAGATLNLALFRITAEVEKADDVQGALRLSVGF